MRSFKKYVLVLATCLTGQVLAQPLDSLLMQVVESNPELKRLHLEFEAEAMKADQVSQLPDPQLGIGVPVLRPETRLGPQVVMVSASQMFPWFGTLKSKEDVVISMSKVKYERIEAERLMLFNKVKIAYYKLQFLHEKEKILKDITKELDVMKAISLSKVEAGQTSSANVLRIQLKIDELSTQLQKIEQEKKQAYAVINGIVLQAWDTVVLPDENVKLAIVSFDLAAFQAKIRADFPMMRMIDLQQELSDERLDVNRKMNAPKLGVGLDYSLVNPRTDMDPMYNGRDILVPKVMLTVPLYRKAYRAKEQEELLVQQSLDFAKDQLEAELLTMLLQFKADYDNAVLDHTLAQKQVETSRVAYSILLTDYSSSGKGFDDLLQVEMQILNYRLDEMKSLLAARVAVSNIERLTDY